MTKSGIDAAQGVVALVGITLGAIPLVQVLFSGTVGSVWRFLPGVDGTAAWVAPTVVVLVALALVAGLERGKRRV